MDVGDAFATLWGRNPKREQEYLSVLAIIIRIFVNTRGDSHRSFKRPAPYHAFEMKSTTAGIRFSSINSTNGRRGNQEIKKVPRFLPFRIRRPNVTNFEMHPWVSLVRQALGGSS